MMERERALRAFPLLFVCIRSHEFWNELIALISLLDRPSFLCGDGVVAEVAVVVCT